MAPNNDTLDFNLGGAVGQGGVDPGWTRILDTEGSVIEPKESPARPVEQDRRAEKEDWVAREVSAPDVIKPVKAPSPTDLQTDN